MRDILFNEDLTGQCHKITGDRQRKFVADLCDAAFRVRNANHKCFNDPGRTDGEALGCGKILEHAEMMPA